LLGAVPAFYNRTNRAGMATSYWAMEKSKTKPNQPNAQSSNWTLGIGVSLGIGHWTFSHVFGYYPQYVISTEQCDNAIIPHGIFPHLTHSSGLQSS
jgi:hypothetical protein